MQRIEIAVGDPVDAAVIQEILMSLADPGVFKGFEFTTPTSDTLMIRPGAALTDSGILIIEDEPITKQIPLTVAPSNFTVYYSYLPNNTFGGNPAVLVIQPGLIPAYTFEQGQRINFLNGVVLGWIQYPGGSVALNTSMFSSAPRLGITQSQTQMKNAFETFYSPFSPRWTQLSLVGPAPTVTETYDIPLKAPITTLKNDGGTQSTVKYLVPFRVPNEGVGQIEVYAQADSGTLLSIYAVDSFGHQITPTNFDTFTNTAMVRQVLIIPPTDTLAANSEMFVEINITMNPTFSAKIKSVGISSYTDPF